MPAFRPVKKAVRLTDSAEGSYIRGVTLGDCGRDSQVRSPEEGVAADARKSMATMISRMTWRELCRSGAYKGLWVAIDNCRYDESRQPLEGDVVDSDTEFSEHCARMREAGRSSCTIVFCESDVFVETDGAAGGAGDLGVSDRTA